MPSEVRFSVVRKLLHSHGWTLVRIRGSHHVFAKPGMGVMVIPVHAQKVKAAYVRQIQKTIEREAGGAEPAV